MTQTQAVVMLVCCCRFWEPGEPNNNIDEDCAVSLFDWTDHPCNYTFMYLWARFRGLIKLSKHQINTFKAMQ